MEGVRMAIRKGQALTELAIGVFALALLVTSLCAFAEYIVKSLKMQNSLRVGSSSQQDQVKLNDFAAEKVFGTSELKIKEKVEMPSMIIMKF